jgi:hypothetical protein
MVFGMVSGEPPGWTCEDLIRHLGVHGSLDICLQIMSD